MRPDSGVCNFVVKTHTRLAGYTGHPALPTRWFTSYGALSPVNGLSCHRRRWDTSRRLDTSFAVPGPHAFAVRLGAARPAKPPRPPHPLPRFVTCATPLGGWDGCYMQVIWVKREAKYFCNQRWFRHNPDTTDLPVGQSHKNHRARRPYLLPLWERGRAPPASA